MIIFFGSFEKQKRKFLLKSTLFKIFYTEGKLVVKVYDLVQVMKRGKVGYKKY